MPLYLYRCQECGLERDSLLRDNDTPCPCGGLSQRVYSVNTIGNAFQPHYNWSVGRHVSSDKDFRRALREQSAIQSERTGTEHDYQPLYPGDKASMTPTGDTEIIETARRKQRETGALAPSKTTIIPL